MTRRINRRNAIASILGVVAAPSVLRAQPGFPNRPIRIVVPVAAGGGVDTFARLIAAKAKTQRDVQFIVENRTGGNSTIGGLDVQRAAPDGYTVLFHASTHNVARLVLKNAPYDPAADFTPIALAGQAPMVLIIANNRPEKTLAEIVAAAKKDPTSLVLRDRPARRARPSRRGRVQPIRRHQCADHSVSRHGAVAERRGRRTRPADDRGDPVAAAGWCAPAACAPSPSPATSARRSRRKSRPWPSVGLPQLDFGAWWAMWGPPGMPAELTKTINGSSTTRSKNWAPRAGLPRSASSRRTRRRRRLRNSSRPISTAAPSCSRRRTSSRSEPARRRLTACSASRSRRSRRCGGTSRNRCVPTCGR